jgi:O-antigen ligase
MKDHYSKLVALRQILKDKDFYTDKILPLLMEYGIYLLAIFFFTDKGESFRTIGLYIPPVALIIRSYLIQKLPFNMNDPLLLFLIALCLSAIVSSLISNEPLLSMNEFKKTYLKVIIIFLVIKITFGKIETFKKLIILLSVLSAMFIIMTYYDYVTKAINVSGEIIYESLRKYNSILAFLIPFVPFALISTKNSLQKILWAFTLFTGLPALLLTGFRGGWVSILVSMLIWSIWFLRRKRSKAFLLIIIGTIVTVTVILILLPSSHIKKRLQEGLSTSDRYEWKWKAYAQIYEESSLKDKLFGEGLTRERMYESYNIWYIQKTGNLPDKNYPLNPHSIYLSILFKQGLLGLILYISLIGIYLTSVIRAIRKTDNLEQKAMGIAILCPFLGEYIVHGLVEDLRFMPLGLVLGLAGGYLNLTKRNRDNTK